MEKLKIFELLKDANNNDICVLDFPLQMERDSPLFRLLEERLQNYSKLISNYMGSIFKESEITTILEFCHGLIEVAHHIDECSFDAGYAKFCEVMDRIYGIFENSCLLVSIQKDNVQALYRARSSKTKIERVEDMFHVPSHKNFNCKSNRFSEIGYPALYLSSSEEGCNLEIRKGDGEDVYIGKYYVNDDQKLKFFDLTILDLPIKGENSVNYYNLNGSLNGNYDLATHLLWPLLACCYIVITDSNEANISYKKEYVIPQYLSRYLRRKDDIDGIRYFTVRNPYLDSYSIKYADYALFTRSYDVDGYDRNLLSKFDITLCSQ